ncbi:hypothetical protein [Aquimarina algiphila]|uniref:hypothetical protein n=1 Tax=Aquimarina algiphila TaxID=2047982 RepID=UPI00232D648E|nr:hypothetical protein [Aquimarina algiphila]
MPANFPEIWLDRVIRNMEQGNVAPWLDGIPEMSADVMTLGENTKTEQNIIHVPLSDFEAEVLINNNTYPIPVQMYDDGSVQIVLDKYQTKVVTISDDQAMGASHDRIDDATKGTTLGLTKNKYAKAIHSIAPLSLTPNTPILQATGPENANGRKILIYDDIVRLKTALDDTETDEEGRRLVLSTDHWNDLLLDRKNFGNQLIDYVKGKPAPVISNFELFSYIKNPFYTITRDGAGKITAAAKLPFGTIPTATDQRASIAYHVNNIAKKTGNTKQYFVAAKDNPKGQTNDLAYRHYFVATPFRAKYLAAIV